MSAPGGAQPATAGGRVVGPAGSVRVRPATAADVPQVGDVTARAYVTDGIVEADHWYAAELRDAVRRVSDATVLVAAVPEPDGPAGTPPPGASGGGAAERVLGTITLAVPGSSYAEIARDGEVELRMLAVDPAARGAGVAEQLVLAALCEAVGRGTRDVVLSTLENMHAAHRLYARLGFVARPERDWSDEVQMRVLTWRAPDAPGALVEAATWPAPRVVDVEGWRVGLSGGVTRRAGSTIALGDVADLPAVVDRVERLYQADGGPAVFRVGDPQNPAGLVAELAARGYVEAAAADVLVRDLAAPDATSGSGPDAPDRIAGVRIRVAEAPDDAWLDLWLAGKGGARAASHAIVTGAPALYLTATDADGADLGVVRAAQAEDWVALSCLQVVPAARRRGLGRALTQEALAAAGRAGARRAFLQVEVENTAAHRLYATLGFRPAHRYAYREQPGAAAGTGC
ncbi:GNAT family N-acetyltransferase [Cellulomonas wangleii]|uniref:GNAT family N-acetyltransferase n=1 Tax=Cellulomonas wangleii TaxID=2816956 RepID=UPI0027DAF76D|nr:GNAT family N-acetyltransferase [Cellulomonas wangleii]